MKITIIHTDGHKQVETAFNSVGECQKALFSVVPAGVIFETDEPVVEFAPEVVAEEPKPAPKKPVKRAKTA